MVKILVKAVVALMFWKPKKWRKSFKMRLTSWFYAFGIRRSAKRCGRHVNVLGPGVNVTEYTTIGDGAGFGKDVKIRGDGPVFIGRFAAIAEDTLIYTQIHDYDHSKILPFGSGFTYPETCIGDYAWIGMRSIILPGTNVGEGAIVQAGSVVMGNVPPCAIVAGNPAKVIGWRDMEHYNAIKAAMGEKPVVPPGARAEEPARREQKPAAGGGGDRLIDVFCRVFSVTPDEVPSMAYKGHPAWDSAGQMALVAALEQDFGISLAPDEIYRLRSYADALSLVNPADAGKMESAVEPAGAYGDVKPAVYPVFNLDRDGIAVIDEGREVTYREFARLADRAAVGLEPHTVKLILNGQDLDTMALFVGCVNHGVVPLMLPSTIDPELLSKLRSTYEGRRTADDLALLLTTSGSTGSPKLVRISRNNIVADDVLSARLFEFDASVRMTMILPICYAWGLSIACAVLDAGGTLVMTRMTVMDAGLSDVMLAANATHLAGVPYMYEVLERCRFFERTFPSLRGLLVSGGALAPVLRRKLAADAKMRGIAFYEAYGQTETTGAMSAIRTDLLPERIGSIGMATHGGMFRVEDGELVYEGGIVSMGYAVCADDLLKGDEWHRVRRTGDLATIDAGGYVTLTGRASRFLKIFGNRVSLDEIENLVKDGFAGAGCGATGADNDLHVFVSSAARDDVQRFLVSKLHFNATVMKVHELDSIPLNANGKVDYPRLKKMAQ